MTTHCRQPGVFPGQDAGRRGEDSRVRQAAVCAEARVLLGHLWRGRLHAGGHLQRRGRDHGRGHRGGAALFLRRRDQGSVREQLALLRPQGVKRIVALRGDMPSPMGPKASSAMPATWWSSSATRPATISSWRWRRIRRPTRARVSPEHDLHAFAMKVKSGANSAITQYFYNPDAYFRFVDDARRLGVSTCPSCRASCRSPIHPADAVLRHVWRRNPALDPLRLQAYKDDTASIRAFGLDVVTGSVREAACRRRAGAAFLHHEPERADAGDLPSATGETE
jgi:hypothetical protein